MTAPAEHELGIPGLADVELVAAHGGTRVYRAAQPALHRIVVVKVVEDGSAAAEPAGAALGAHPNIVRVHASGTTSAGHRYVVMEHLANGSLADLATAGRAVLWREVPSLLVRLGGALATAHDAGIVHGNVTAANVLFSAYGEPQLTDFRGGVASPAAVREDLVALATTVAAVVDAAEPAPEPLARVVDRMRRGRYRSAVEAAHAVQRAAAAVGLPVTPLPLPTDRPAAAPAPQRRHRRATVVAAAAAVAAVAVLGVLAVRSNTAPDTALADLLVSPAGLPGDWREDADLADQLRANPDAYLCGNGIDTAAATDMVVAAYRAGTPGPRFASVVRNVGADSASSVVGAVDEQRRCLGELGGLAAVDVRARPLGDGALQVRYTRPTAQLELEVLAVYVQRGAVLGQLVVLGYPRVDAALTQRLTQRLDEQLRSAAHAERPTRFPLRFAAHVADRLPIRYRRTREQAHE